MKRSRLSHADVRVVGVLNHVEGSLSGRQVSIPPVEPWRQTCPDILGGNHGNVLERGDTLVVDVEEHHHLYPVGVDAAPVAREEISATTEVALYLRGTRLVSKHLLRYWRQVRKHLATSVSPPRQYFPRVQLHSSSTDPRVAGTKIRKRHETHLCNFAPPGKKVKLKLLAVRIPTLTCDRGELRST